MVKHGSIDKVYHATFFLLKEKVPSILRHILKNGFDYLFYTMYPLDNIASPLDFGESKRIDIFGINPIVSTCRSRKF